MNEVAVAVFMRTSFDCFFTCGRDLARAGRPLMSEYNADGDGGKDLITSFFFRIHGEEPKQLEVATVQTSAPPLPRQQPKG